MDTAKSECSADDTRDTHRLVEPCTYTRHVLAAVTVVESTLTRAAQILSSPTELLVVRTVLAQPSAIFYPDARPGCIRKVSLTSTEAPCP